MQRGYLICILIFLSMFISGCTYDTYLHKDAVKHDKDLIGNWEYEYTFYGSNTISYSEERRKITFYKDGLMKYYTYDYIRYRNIRPSKNGTTKTGDFTDFGSPDWEAEWSTEDGLLYITIITKGNRNYGKTFATGYTVRRSENGGFLKLDSQGYTYKYKKS